MISPPVGINFGTIAQMCQIMPYHLCLRECEPPAPINCFSEPIVKLLCIFQHGYPCVRGWSHVSGTGTRSGTFLQKIWQN